jgi:hypothetical protein
MSYLPMGATDPVKTAISATQTQVNRFAQAGGFAAVGVDGIFGTKTQQGVYNSLKWISKATLVDQIFRDAAVTWIANWDGKAGLQLSAITIHLGNVANSLGLGAGKRPPTTTTVATGGGAASTLNLTGSAGGDGGIGTSVLTAWNGLGTVGKIAAVGILGGIGYFVLAKGKKKGR